MPHLNLWIVVLRSDFGVFIDYGNDIISRVFQNRLRDLTQMMSIEELVTILKLSTPKQTKLWICYPDGNQVPVELFMNCGSELKI